jgi:hypothetical protein
MSPVRASANSHEAARFEFNIRTNARSAAASRALVADGIKNVAAFGFRQRHGGGRSVVQQIERWHRWLGRTSTLGCRASYCWEAGHIPGPARRRRRRTLRWASQTEGETGREVLMNQCEQCGACLLVNTHSPVPSQHRILIRVCRRLLNTNSAPARGSSPNRSVTTACNPLNPLRRSQGSTATSTFKLPEKLNMAWPASAIIPPPRSLVWYR